MSMMATDFSELIAVAAFEDRYSEPTSSDILMIDILGDESHIIEGAEFDNVTYREKLKKGVCKKNSWADIQPVFSGWLKQAYGSHYLGFNSFSFRKEKHLKSDWESSDKIGDVYGTLIVDTPISHFSTSTRIEEPFSKRLIKLTKDNKYITPSSVLFGSGVKDVVIEKCLFFAGTCPKDLKANIDSFKKIGVIIVETYVDLDTKRVLYNILGEKNEEVVALKSRLLEVGKSFAYTLQFYLLSAQNARSERLKSGGTKNRIMELDDWGVLVSDYCCEVHLNHVVTLNQNHASDKNPFSDVIAQHALLCVAANRDRFSSVVTISPFKYIDITTFLSSYKQIVFATKLLGSSIDRNRLGSVISELERASVRSAIGSIMSRNGSHNIGSHVLSALTHNVGTMPDDRVLYQYIQHRMDYIATATTGFPDWGVPTMFVGEIMRNFMIQHHLLDHIVESEGLHAYHFQGHNACTEKNEHNALRIRIVSVDGNKGDGDNREYSFVSYPDDMENCADAALHDVRLAIPGGVAGHHAIYTILENVIRNAAKHGWAIAKQNKPKNLEITIKFENAEGNRVRFIVFDNVGKDRKELEALVEGINRKLNARLISGEGEGGLRQENWGMAEMRISAAYLQRRSLAETGGLKALTATDCIIKAISVDRKYLGYEFFVSKPKEILFVMPSHSTCEEFDLKLSAETTQNDGCANDLNELTWGVLHERIFEDPSLIKNFEKNGIHLAFENEKEDGYYEFVLNGERQDRRQIRNMRYEYAILPRLPKNLKDGMYPFRILILDKSGVNDIVWDTEEVFDTAPIGDKMMPSLWGNHKAIKKWLGDIIVGHDSSDVSSSMRNLKNYIYLRWLQYLEKRTRNPSEYPRDISVLVDTNGTSDRNAGQGLISDYDVCKYIFEHVWGTILDDVVKDDVPCGGELLKTIKDEKLSVVELFNRLEYVKQENKSQHLPSKKREEIFRGVVQLLLDETMMKRHTHADLSKLGDALVCYLMGAYPATHALLRKYAEKIDTLPESFCEVQAIGSPKTQSMQEQEINKCSREEISVPSIGYIGEMYLRRKDTSAEFGNNEKKFSITYCRHGDNDEREIYRSGLSGSQSSFSQFQHLEYCSADDKETRISMFAHLVENALMRVLIIDERVCHFLSARKRISDKLICMNVRAVDTNMEELDADSDNDIANNHNDGLKSDCQGGCLRIDWKKFKDCSLGSGELSEVFLPGKFDVLIIHQGIIDKLLGDSCSVESVRVFLERMKKIIPYVVITTGRGRPANTPVSARILPFPCVERYLFQEWPEKYLLINSVMNLLPCGESNVNV